MNRKLWLYVMLATLAMPLDAVPIEEVAEKPVVDATQNAAVQEVTLPPPIEEGPRPAGSTSSSSSSASGEDDDNSPQPPDNEPSASSIEPAVYGNYLPPDAFQQYVNQFGAAAAAYAPYAAAYPAPIGYGPPAPIYPSPYVVQTGYEGYLVPSTTVATTTDQTAMASTTESGTDSMNTSILNPIGFLNNFLTSVMMSTFFRVLAAVMSFVGVMLFTNAMGSFICNVTPLCDFPSRAMSYLKRSASTENVGRLLAEEVTPERIRRATEFVRQAIRKYRDLQRLTSNEINQTNAPKEI